MKQYYEICQCTQYCLTVMKKLECNQMAAFLCKEQFNIFVLRAYWVCTDYFPVSVFSVTFGNDRFLKINDATSCRLKVFV